jgi:hypothetical protein
MQITGRGRRTFSAGLLGLMLATAGLLAIVLLASRPALAEPADSGLTLTELGEQPDLAAENVEAELQYELDTREATTLPEQQLVAQSAHDGSGGGSSGGQGSGTTPTPMWAYVAPESRTRHDDLAFSQDGLPDDPMPGSVTPTAAAGGGAEGGIRLAQATRPDHPAPQQSEALGPGDHASTADQRSDQEGRLPKGWAERYGQIVLPDDSVVSPDRVEVLQLPYGPIGYIEEQGEIAPSGRPLYSTWQGLQAGTPQHYAPWWENYKMRGLLRSELASDGLPIGPTDPEVTADGTVVFHRFRLPPDGQVVRLRQEVKPDGTVEFEEGTGPAHGKLAIPGDSLLGIRPGWVSDQFRLPDGTVVPLETIFSPYLHVVGFRTPAREGTGLEPLVPEGPADPD